MTNALYPITIGATGDLLLVRRDGSMTNALEVVSYTLDAARAMVLEEAESDHSPNLYGVVTLIELAKGIAAAMLDRAYAQDEQEASHGA